ncbi:Uncharacterised protein [uncultured archaeon]|nr:Uncharacterised protein [uncultured archaeon]
MILKVGEIWEAKSYYAGYRCVVIIPFIQEREDIIFCKILKSEDYTLEDHLGIFRIEDFIRKIPNEESMKYFLL